ncbi:PASTA domain-containing protein [Micromonospora okii]|uniref:PASTA domain-containing protein n=1 Tax=Micromonospora okii TaxID=1182970 RepID=UPI001E5B5E6D|nr:PASTA domain-containing protein [Micromonospora okii]
MTDGNTAVYPGEPGAAGPGRGAKVLGGGLAAALLATIGAAGGWVLAGEDASPPVPPVAEAGVAAPRSSSASPPARTTAPAPRTSAPKRSTGLTVPPVVGTDFEDARDELRERGLGWRLVFGSGTGRDVQRTDPPVGAEVRRGVTVALHVAGAAPAVDVPDLIGDDCDEAAEDLVEEGLYPRYPTGGAGTVTAQDPEPDSTAYWNDEVALTCGKKQKKPDRQGSSPPDRGSPR